MTNMSNCRFHNTLADLRDCYDHLDDPDMSKPEMEERRRLIMLCCRIAFNYEDELDEQ